METEPMKKNSDKRNKQKDVEEKTNYIKCLVRDTKLSSFLEGNPSRNFQIFVFVYSDLFNRILSIRCFSLFC